MTHPAFTGPPPQPGETTQQRNARLFSGLFNQPEK
jgi:hypothetical protein